MTTATYTAEYLTLGGRANELLSATGDISGKVYIYVSTYSGKGKKDGEEELMHDAISNVDYSPEEYDAPQGADTSESSKKEKNRKKTNKRDIASTSTRVGGEAGEVDTYDTGNSFGYEYDAPSNQGFDISHQMSNVTKRSKGKKDSKTLANITNTYVDLVDVNGDVDGYGYGKFDGDKSDGARNEGQLQKRSSPSLFDIHRDAKKRKSSSSSASRSSLSSSLSVDKARGHISVIDIHSSPSDTDADKNNASSARGKSKLNNNATASRRVQSDSDDDDFDEFASVAKKYQQNGASKVGRSYQNNSLSDDAVRQDTGKPSSAKYQLSSTSKKLFLNWMFQYRTRWTNYWTYLNNTTIDEMSKNIPCSINELKLIGGMGEKKVHDYGEHILGTIWSFLKSHNILSHFPDFETPTIPPCATWQNPISDEAESIRLAQNPIGQQKNYNRPANGSDSSSNLKQPVFSSPHTSAMIHSSSPYVKSESILNDNMSHDTSPMSPYVIPTKDGNMWRSVGK